MEKLRERLVVANWIVTSALVGIVVGLTTLFWKQIPPLIPIFYSRPWGESQLGSGWWLLGLAVVMAGIGLVNFLTTKKIGEMVLAGMVSIGFMIAQLILTLGILRILMLIV